MTDDRHHVIFDIDAPPDPGYLLEVLEAHAEAVRVANHMTRHHEALEFPAEGDQLVRELESAASRLPQLLDQIASWYEQEAAAGRLEVPSGDRAGSPEMAVVAIRMRADAARKGAEQLQADLASLGQVTATLAAPDTGEDDQSVLAILCAAAALQECTYCNVASGPCVTGPDGWHLARFLGVLPGRAETRLVEAAATPHGSMGGIVRMSAQAGEDSSDDD